MAIQSPVGHTYFPRIPLSVAAAPTIGTVFSLTAANPSAAYLIQAPKTGSIRKIHWGTGTVAGSGSATVNVRVKQVDYTTAPAIPHATNLWGVDTSVDQTVNAGDDNTRFTSQLTADAAVVKGDVIAIELFGTAFGSITSITIAGFSDDQSTSKKFPYALGNTAGTYAEVVTAPIVGLEYDDGTYTPVPGCSATSSTTTTTFGSGSTPDTIGQRFQFPMPVRVGGFWLWADTDDDFTVRLVTADYHQANATGILTSIAVKGTARGTNTSGIHEILFPADIDLAADTNYRLIVEPGATGITIYDQAFSTLALMDAFPGGRNFHLTTAKDPTADGSWTNFNSGTFRSLYCGLLLKGFDDAAQTGGDGGDLGTVLVYCD